MTLLACLSGPASVPSVEAAAPGPQADLSIAVSDNGPFTVGQGATYAITVANAGPDPSGPITVIDTLPTGISFVSATGAGWTCAAAGQPVTCTNVSGLPAVASSVLDLVVAVGGSTGLTPENTVSASGATPDPNPANNVSGDAAAVIIAAPAVADLGITSNHSGSFVAGRGASYTLTASNAGPQAAPLVMVTDTLPAGMSFVSSSGAGWNCSAIGQSVVCSDPSGLSAGANAPITINAAVAADAVPGGANVVGISSLTPDPNPANNAYSDPTVVLPSADLGVVLSHSGVFWVGQEGTYTVAVSNAGPSSSGALTLSDVLPPGLTLVSTSVPCTSSGQVVTCSLSSLPAQATTSFKIVVAVDAAALPSVVNSAHVSSLTLDPNPANDTSSDPTTVAMPTSDVSVASSHSGNFVVGQAGMYALNVANAGPAPSGPLTITDVLPAGLGLLSAGGAGWACVAAGQVVTCTSPAGLPSAGTSLVDLFVTVASAALPSVTNTANLTSASPDPNPANNATSDATTVVLQADVSIISAHVGGFTVGQNGTYSLTVTNRGPSPSGSITATDTLPAGLGFVSGAGAGWTCSATGQLVTCTNPTGLAAGSSSPFSLVVSVTSAAAPAGNNTATVTALSPDPTPANNSAADATSIFSPGPGADLSITGSHTGTFGFGQMGQYTLLVKNNGPAAASGPVVVTDQLPTGLTFVSGVAPGWLCSANRQAVTCTSAAAMPAGASSTIALTIKLAQSACVLTNTASVSSVTPDPVLANNSSSDPTAVQCSVSPPISGGGGSPAPPPVAIAPPFLSVVKSHSGSFTVGQPGTYSIAITNDLPVTSGAVTVTDDLPPGLSFIAGTGTGWNCSSAGQLVTCANPAGIPGGGSSSLSLVVSVTAAVAPAVTNTALVSFAAVPGASATASDATAVLRPAGPAADLSVVSSHAGNFTAGQGGTYTLTVGNAGPSPSGPIAVVDTLPTGASFLSASGSGWACSAFFNQVVCTNSAGLPSGGVSTLGLLVGVGLTAAPVIVNSATVSAATADPLIANNAGNDSTIVGGPPPVPIGGTGGLPATGGGGAPAGPPVAAPGTAGSGAVPPVTPPPPVVSPPRVVAPPPVVTPPSVITATTLPVPPAAVSPAGPSLNGAVPVPAVIPPVAPPPPTGATPPVLTSLALAMTRLGPLVVAKNATYALTVSNVGPANSGALTLRDVLPPSLSFVSAAGAGWSCSADGNVVDCSNPGGLPAGATSRISLVVLVRASGVLGVTTRVTVDGAGVDPDKSKNVIVDTAMAAQPTAVTPGLSGLVIAGSGFAGLLLLLILLAAVLPGLRRRVPILAGAATLARHRREVVLPPGAGRAPALPCRISILTIDAGEIGHVGICLTRGTYSAVFSYYPAPGSSPWDMIQGVPGRVDIHRGEGDRTSAAQDWGFNHSKRSVELVVNFAQWEMVRLWWEAMAANPGRYILAGSNCASRAMDSLSAAGIFVFPAWSTPTTPGAVNQFLAAEYTDAIGDDAAGATATRTLSGADGATVRIGPATEIPAARGLVAG